MTHITEWTAEEIEDLLTDAITDSADLDWTARDGAKSIMRELASLGLRITYTEARADLVANPPVSLDPTDLNDPTECMTTEEYLAFVRAEQV